MFEQFISIEILNKIVFWSSLNQYLKAIFCFLLFMFILGILQKIILNFFKKISSKTKTDLDDMIVKIISGIKPKFYILLSIYLALRIITLSVFVVKIIDSVFILVIIFQLAKSLRLIINFIVNKFNGGKENEEHNNNVANTLGTITIFFVWVLGILMILSNMGINISSLLAGVGISGVAVAFALREILADLFASISIYFDKPFKIGDLISVDGKSGVVERIGLKTTRIRANSDEEIIFSNKDLTSSCIHNFKKSENKKVKFLVKINHETSTEKMKMVNDIFKEIIEKIENVEFSGSYFKEMGDKANVFEISYKITSKEENVQEKIQQEINFQICEQFKKNEIEMV